VGIVATDLPSVAVRPLAPWRERLGSARAAEAARLALPVLGASAAVAWLASNAPVAALAVAGSVAVASALATRPAVLLLAVLLLRPSLDTSGSLLTVADTNAAGLLGALVAASGGLVLLLKGPRLPARIFTVPLLGFLALALASVSYSLNPSQGIREWVGLVALLVVFCLAAWVVKDARGVKRVATVLLAASVVPIAVGLVQIATGDTVAKAGYAAISGTFVNPNAFAIYLVVVLTVALISFFEARTLLGRTCVALVLGGAGVCLVLTYTRVAWLTFALIVLVLAVMHYRRLVLGVVVVLLVGAVVVPQATSSLTSRFSDLSSTSASYSDNSWQWRTENWSRMMPYAFSRPVAGHGLASYPGLSLQVFGRFDYNFVGFYYYSQLRGGKSIGADTGIVAHNDFVKLAVETGFLGAGLWLAALIGLIATTYRARRAPGLGPWGTGGFALALMVLAVSASDDMQGNGPALIAVLALAGALVGASRAARDRAPATAAAQSA
jgi:O-antigen ligase